MHGSAYSFVADTVRAHASHSRGRVLEAGSLNINGSVRDLFPEAAEYIGVDVAEGNGVDWQGWFADYRDDKLFDVVVSTEMLEHDPFWHTSVQAMIDNLKEGGLLIITAAAPGRPEHGTAQVEPEANPYLSMTKEWHDYYYAIDFVQLEKQLKPHLEKVNGGSDYTDTILWGIKKQNGHV